MVTFNGSYFIPKLQIYILYKIYFGCPPMGTVRSKEPWKLLDFRASRLHSSFSGSSPTLQSLQCLPVIRLQHVNIEGIFGYTAQACLACILSIFGRRLFKRFHRYSGKKLTTKNFAKMKMVKHVKQHLNKHSSFPIVFPSFICGYSA